MNKITARVKEIVSLERLNLIKCELNTQTLNVLVLELNFELKEGDYVELIIKPTAISVVKEKIEFENCLKAEVLNVNRGKIISSVMLKIEDFEMEVITLNTIETRGQVYAVFKANDIAVLRVLDES